MQNNNIDTWAKGRNSLCAFLSVQIMAAAETQHNFIMALHLANIASQIPQSDITSWTCYYKNSKLLKKYFFDNIVKEFISPAFMDIKFLRLMIRAANANPPQKKRISKLFEKVTEKDVEDTVKQIKTAMKDDVENTLIEKSTDSQQENKNNPIDGELIFIYNNYLRCLVEYNEYFFRLYRQARLGKKTAIIKLLRLDPLILEDKFIRGHFQTAQPELSAKYQKAYNTPLKYHTKPEKIKVSFAGLISAIFESFDINPITPAEIRNLFDSYAMDAYQKPCDEDLPCEDDAFRKAVKRHHKLWYPMISKLLNPSS